MMSCHECHSDVYLDEGKKKNGLVGSALLSQGTASQCEPVSSQGLDFYSTEIIISCHFPHVKQKAMTLTRSVK